MNYDGDLLVPGTMNGNVFVTVQPPRGLRRPQQNIPLRSVPLHIIILAFTIGSGIFGKSMQ